jgi:hypothetical protein
MHWVESALFVVTMLAMMGAMTIVLNRSMPAQECPRCNRFPRSAREDGLCRICRDPQLAYLWLTAF